MKIRRHEWTSRNVTPTRTKQLSLGCLITRPWLEQLDHPWNDTWRVEEHSASEELGIHLFGQSACHLVELGELTVVATCDGEPLKVQQDGHPNKTAYRSRELVAEEKDPLSNEHVISSNGSASMRAFELDNPMRTMKSGSPYFVNLCSPATYCHVSLPTLAKIKGSYLKLCYLVMKRWHLSRMDSVEEILPSVAPFNRVAAWFNGILDVSIGKNEAEKPNIIILWLKHILKVSTQGLYSKKAKLKCPRDKSAKMQKEVVHRCLVLASSIRLIDSSVR
ncbi:hypothetical protein Ae201684_017596 [Aphanomyces euteiches]|uniref:Uncharacterized protein n=1 Tax=Aphanomyces euteiches TaxID=100861 RepID=A0A6G0W8T2_9STRA|nr:hypothetical protein Ae201684_017596 [Aphanomyces euteiches]